MKNASTVPDQYVRKPETLCMALIACFIATILSGFSCTANAGIPSSENKALRDLYNSTNGGSWTTNAGWNDVAGTECSPNTSWWGVTCDATFSHVTQIDLRSNNLIGTLPDLSAFIELQKFNVYGNQLSGEIPPLLSLTNLTLFSVGSNQLTGAIPSLSGLTNLTRFIINSNQLTGAIPLSLSGLTNLTYFYAYSNQLTGAIPDLSGLNALQYFRVGGNHLTGGLPVAPSGLVAGESTLCANDFPESSYVASPAWDAATGATPWYTPCNEIFKNGFE